MVYRRIVVKYVPCRLVVKEWLAFQPIELLCSFENLPEDTKQYGATVIAGFIGSGLMIFTSLSGVEA